MGEGINNSIKLPLNRTFIPPGDSLHNWIQNVQMLLADEPGEFSPTNNIRRFNT